MIRGYFGPDIAADLWSAVLRSEHSRPHNGDNGLEIALLNGTERALGMYLLAECEPVVMSAPKFYCCFGITVEPRCLIPM